MNKTTYIRISLIISFLFLGLQSYAQNFVPFTPSFNQDLRGDIVLIGNNILGPNNNPFNDNTVTNDAVNMQYIDIDGDGSTYSSSSANLVIPNPNCYEIKYAGLYWGAVSKGAQPIRNIKFKGPTGGYNDITGTIIFNAGNTSVDGGNSFPYACFADVTSIVTGLANNLGTYTMANVSSRLGRTADVNNGTGNSAGWSLFIVYEDPTLPGKSITSFNGFSSVTKALNPTVDVLVDGFRTVPAPAPVRANFAFATLEGDKAIPGDQLRLNGANLSAADRPANNFFNSSVTRLNATPVNNRNPNSTNTLGFDTGVMIVPNPGNTVIANDATSAIVRLESTQDTYFPYFYAFAVDIIEPNIVLTKIVEDEFGNNIGGQTVGLGQELNYVIGFQNTGNDDARNFTIRDILPVNIIYNHPTDLVLPAGVSVVSYNPITREIVLKIEDFLVEENDPVSKIRIEVQVVEDCRQLIDACTNIINNQAFATYYGTLNPDFQITDDPSINTNTGCLLTPQATNFLANLDDCVFSEDITLCGDSVVLTAANGYDSYSWSTSPTGAPVIGTGQTITVTGTGTYYSFNTALAPCQSIVQEFQVNLFGGTMPNPIIPYADEVVTCPNDGKLLPNIYLCGANDIRNLNVQIGDATGIIWEQLDEASCPPIGNSDCANENNACTWNQVATGANYVVNTSGQFRLTINYPGGCFNEFYFNVYQNVLNPTVTSTDIVCETPGSILVGNVPSGYEYSIDGTNYQDSNSFTVTTPGLYTIYIRVKGLPGTPCIFTIPDVLIRKRDFTVSSIITQPLCNGDKGSIRLAANDAEPQYFFELRKGGTLVNSVGPIGSNNYEFPNLNPGNYSATVKTEDGCTKKIDFTIINPPLLTVNAAITQPLTCTDGEITVYPSGGTPPYFYFVNSTTDFQTVPEIVVTAPGVYNITVVDSNNCSADTQITIEETPAPVFTVDHTDILCGGSGNTGSITFNVTNPNGNSIKYSIDGGATYFNSPVFTGLAAGDYDVSVRYTTGPSVCESDPQTITIIEVTAIAGEAELTAPYTCTDSGTITAVNVTGGTAPFMYSIDGVTFQSSPIFTGLTAGTYTITIKDANDCASITNTITIPALNPPTNLAFSSSQLTCPANLSTVTITSTTGGVAPLLYRIISPSTTTYQSSNVFANLAPGIYTFEVKDANDCIYSETYQITPLPTIDVVGQVLNDVTCLGDADGSARFTVTGTTNFEYSINGGAPTTAPSPIVLTGLAGGVYTIVVRDVVTNCEATTSVTVEAPSALLEISTTVTPIKCITDGRVVINATGGWGGNSYSLTLPDGTVLGPKSNKTFSNLTQAGTYTATVEDSNGCIATETFELTIPETIVATISGGSDLCYDTTDKATLEVLVTSGQAPFKYSINGNPFKNSNIFANLGPGTYTITVRDAFGCELTLPAQIIEQQLIVNVILTKDIDCTSSPDGLITGTFSGGTAPFTHAVSINGSAYTNLVTTGSPFTYSTSVAATYQFRITDALGCTAISNIITINPISLPELVVLGVPQDALCNGEASGSISVTFDPTVGTAPFTINVTHSNGTNYGTQTSGLPAGTYVITLSDANSCTDTTTLTIGEPDPITVDFDKIDITCVSGNDSKGEIIITGISGGTGLYDIYVTSSNGYSSIVLDATGTTDVRFEVIDFGLYQINVIDDNGCSVLIKDILIASPPSDLGIIIEPTVDCASGGEATITITNPLPGSGPFWFAIYRGPSTVYPLPAGDWIPANPLGGLSTVFTGLTPGVTYTFIVYDELSMCSYYEQAEIPVPSTTLLTVDTDVVNNVTCTGSDDGSVSFTITSGYGGNVDVEYQIFESFSLNPIGGPVTGTVPGGGTLSVTDLGPLLAGNYYVLIKETSGPNAGCGVITAPFNILESQIQLDLLLSIDKNANCNVDSGIISATGKFGTAPYKYQITTTPTAPIATDPNWANASTFNVNAGTYYVHVLDKYGCIVTKSIDMVMDPSPIVAATVANQCDTDEGAFKIDVVLATAGTAPYSFSIDGGAFQRRTPPFTYSGLSSGNHTIAIKDANGCGNSIDVLIEAPLGITPTVTAEPSCSNDDGEITVSATGGTGSYSYSINPNAPSIVLTGNVFSGVPSGNFTVTVTDTATLCTEDVTVNLEAATPVTFDTVTDDATCNGALDGVITVNLLPGNDNPIYTYEIIAPIVRAPQNSNIFTGLPADTYTVRVTSGKNCIATGPATIGQPTPVVATVLADTFKCKASNNPTQVKIEITGNGGTAPYRYSINGTSYFNSNIFNVVDTGVQQTFTVYVKDNNGCIATEMITIEPLPTITAAAFSIVKPIDCNNTGSVRINVDGGSGNFTYQLLPNGPTVTTNEFDIPGPGTYYFRVTDLDTDCYFLTDGFVVNPFDLIDANLIAVTDNSCFGDTDGELELTIIGYTGSYTYQLLDGSGTPIGGNVNANTATDPQLITGLASGNYSVSIIETETPFCSTNSNTANIASPPTPLILDAKETASVTCTDDQGVITAVATGGTAPYQYQLSGPINIAFSSEGRFTDLKAGTYTVTVKDAQDCTETKVAILAIPTPIDGDFILSTNMLTCFGDTNAFITIENTSGGAGSGYTYTLNTISPVSANSGPQLSNTFTGLGAGVYSVTITDPYSCEKSFLPLTINQPTKVAASLSVVKTQTCLTPSRLTLSATGGNGPYEYSANSNFNTILGSFASSITFDVFTNGRFKYYVRDNNGCKSEASNDIKIDRIPKLIVELDAINAQIGCVGDNSGSITATATGGLGNYIYTLIDKSTGNTISTINVSPAIFTNLYAGNYEVDVKSGDCDNTSKSIRITEPNNALKVDYVVENVSCNGENNGRLIITATGGTKKIKYAISPRLDQFFDNNEFNNLAPGDYTALVVDKNGCFVEIEFTITEPEAVLIAIDETSVFQEICEGDSNASFSIEISGGSLPYSVRLDKPNGPYKIGDPTQTIFNFDNLSGGEHTIYIRDNAGCESIWVYTLDDAVFIDPAVIVEYVCDNNLTSNMVTVEVDASNTDLTQLVYSLNGGPYQQSNVFANLPTSKDNYVTVKHSNGCEQITEFFDIKGFDAIQLTVKEGGLNEIIATTTGGTGEYQYTLNGENFGSTNTFIITKTGNYEVIVTDSSGCSASALIFMTYIEICIPNYFTPNNDGRQDTWAPGCAANYPNIKATIFDRYGRKIAVLRAGESWDGKYNGRELPTGDYWFVVILDSKKDREFVGHFTLYR